MRFDIYKGKNVFVTGATGGLGREICILLAHHGCNIFMTSTNKQKLEDLKNIIKSQSRVDVSYCVGDLKNVKDIQNVCDSVLQAYGDKTDIVINCAGIFPLKSLTDTTLEDYERCMNVNVKAPFIFANSLTAGMKERKWGRVMNVGSSSAYGGSADAGLYCISKHALLGLSRSLYQELKEENIRVYSYSPGSIRTPMGATDKRQDFSTFLDPKEVAEYVAFMMSYDSELISEEVRVNRIVVR
jgi:NAD(P)-dependent dehydrogenase (short-subunit alcohol dehydrogenase family)